MASSPRHLLLLLFYFFYSDSSRLKAVQARSKCVLACVKYKDLRNLQAIKSKTLKINYHMINTN